MNKLKSFTNKPLLKFSVVYQFNNYNIVYFDMLHRVCYILTVSTKQFCPLNSY